MASFFMDASGAYDRVTKAASELNGMGMGLFATFDHFFSFPIVNFYRSGILIQGLVPFFFPFSDEPGFEIRYFSLLRLMHRHTGI